MDTMMMVQEVEEGATAQRGNFSWKEAHLEGAPAELMLRFGTALHT